MRILLGIFQVYILLFFFSCSFVGDLKEKTKELISLVPLSEGEKQKDHESFSEDAMVVTQGEYSTKAGLEMFKLGGNAFDAAAAVSFAISVERPQSTGIGGGGFMLFHAPLMKEPIALDFREKAPLKATDKMFLDENGELIPNKSLDGIWSGAVPGMVAGIIEIQKKYGKLPLSDILRPAIRLAEEGFKVYPHLADAIENRAEVIKKFPASMEIFFRKDGTPLKDGDLLQQKDLAKTLKAIMEHGKDGFYSGWVADAIVKEQKRLGGLISHEDLSSYHVKYRKPVEGKFKDYTIYSMSPPSSGGIHIIQILNIIEKDRLKQLGIHSAKTIHLVSSAMQMAFADRAKYLGDTDFVKVPIKGLLSKEYAQNLRKQIDLTKSREQNEVRPGNPLPYESEETTHFTIMDKDGITIASTQTINGWMGSGLVIPGTGILLNNEMDDFSAKVGSQNLFGAIGGFNNQVAPRKRPLSSMSPTIVFKEDRPVLALGSPAGTKILTCVAQTILNYLEHELPLYEAIATVRYHHQWYPHEIRIGEDGLPEETLRDLKKMGHTITVQDLGCRVQAVALERERLHGVSDPRGEGLAQGL